MTVRPRIVKVLWSKEWLRLQKQPMAILLLGLLTAFCVLLASSGPQIQRDSQSPLPKCLIVYDSKIDTGWMNSLRERLKSHEHPPIEIVRATDILRVKNVPNYPNGACAIELSKLSSGQLLVVFRHPGNTPDILWPHSQWFWAATLQHFKAIPDLQIAAYPMGTQSPRLTGDILKQTSLSDLVKVELIGSVLIFAAQFFCGVHLLISFSSQDRERGTSLALALTPASVTEIIIAKCLFHLSLTLTMIGLIIGILKPVALTDPILWGALAVSSIGFISVGILLASLARTQASAALLTLCYMLGVALIYHMATDFAAFDKLRQLMFEHRSFQLILVGLKTGLGGAALSKLLSLTGVVACWLIVATQVFARRGWR
jgi:hypothetical protein